MFGVLPGLITVLFTIGVIFGKVGCVYDQNKQPPENYSLLYKYKQCIG